MVDARPCARPIAPPRQAPPPRRGGLADGPPRPALFRRRAGGCAADPLPSPSPPAPLRIPPPGGKGPTPPGPPTILKARLAEAKPPWSATHLGDAIATVADVLADAQNGNSNKNAAASEKAARQVILISDMQQGAHV